MSINIGFLPLTWIDVLDILILTILFYKLYMVIRGTVAAQIFASLIGVVIISLLVQASNLTALTWLLQKITDIWVIAFIILFQPEIRRVLVLFGRSKIIRYFLKLDVDETIEAICEAALELSRLHHGALIIVTRGTGMRTFVENGVPVNASVSKQLLLSIFYPKSPLHDGAVIVKDRIIEAARCTLPLSNITKTETRLLGMRHRAGLGISEQADVLAVIVSEETGHIAIAENGVLHNNLAIHELKQRLSEEFLTSEFKSWKNIFKGTKSEY
jgi:diadenylate cyclase